MDYTFSDDPQRLDHEVIRAFLMAEAYWGRWRTAEQISACIDGSWRVVGGYDAQGSLVAFARAISDGVSIAYLSDVFVLPEHRRHGLGVRLVAEMIENGPGAGFRWLLHTEDAHGLYERFGFKPGDHTVLERPRPTAQ
ncbi:GNAT family N-acetyltransferase [Tomitella biformata]|uniref:GNAT family N-acetyltransferase n=1 Tax=Tomitella biformata TaxID=630403 RepID=UPI00046517A0|nr:GNAT family N-acetyltransferase [Tomitella biformata]